MFINRWITRFTLALAASFLCAAGFGGIAMLIDSGVINEWDRIVIAAVQGAETPGLTSVMKLFSLTGEKVPVALITAAAGLFLFTVLGHRKELLLLAISVGGSGALNVWLKLLFQRARPTIYRLADAPGYSFPSGHSMAAFCLYATIAYLLWRHIPHKVGRVLLIALSTLFIAAIGYSRIYLGVHYPSDVVGGYLASGCWLFGLIWAYSGFGKKTARYS